MISEKLCILFHLRKFRRILFLLPRQDAGWHVVHFPDTVVRGVRNVSSIGAVIRNVFVGQRNSSHSLESRC